MFYPKGETMTIEEVETTLTLLSRRIAQIETAVLAMANKTLINQTYAVITEQISEISTALNEFEARLVTVEGLVDTYME